ncbi:uncharacterized protein LOC134410259 [Elgaria multicarinata webbii]|uniref:uncharacterized protein LOC134410259 n=1 Tax=Elgaria multicarinata webbii TaxID=159646 RepID=UPI002FCCCFBB
MGSTEGEDSVILITEDKDENPVESSVVLIESSEEFPLEKKNMDEIVDDECEVIVTFCKRAKVMPHARYDCMTHPFERAECETSCPLGRNTEMCGQCYCYICDKLAAECKDWVTPSLCHCNAHNKSKYWKDQWHFALTGGLAMFNLELSEIDVDIQHGGVLLQKFIHDISMEYNKYLSGERIPSDYHKCYCHRKLGPGQCDDCGLRQMCVIYRYTPVFDLVTTHLNQAENEKPKAEVIVLLGAAKEIMLHKDPFTYSQTFDPLGSVNQAVPCLMVRITRRLQRLLVLNEFPKPLYDKFIGFYQSIPLPVHCSTFSNSLNFMTWHHSLLTSVLKGQNVTGRRTQKGKKEYLCEIFPVIEARIERMENRQEYKELIRYLKVVKCSDSKWMQKQRDKIPLYMCRSGDFVGATQALFNVFSKSSCTACRLSPSQFEGYLKMFRTGQAPLGRSLEVPAQWSPVAPPSSSLGEPLKLPVLLKQTFRLLHTNMSLFKNPKCWTSVIKTFSSHPVLGNDGRLTAITLKEPPQEFQQMVFRESCYILEELVAKVRTNVFLSDVFRLDLHLEAGLIFAVTALRQMVLQEYRSLGSFLDIILAFRNNFWALKLLIESLACHEKALCGIVGLIITDLHYRKAEMLELCRRRGPQYVGDLLCLFLTSRDRNVPSIGISIINVIVDNLQECHWAKQVGYFLQNSTKAFGWAAYEVSSFIAISQTLP